MKKLTKVLILTSGREIKKGSMISSDKTSKFDLLVTSKKFKELEEDGYFKEKEKKIEKTEQIENNNI